MKKLALGFSALVALGACTAVTDTDDDGTGGSTTIDTGSITVPTELTSSLTSASYNPSSGTLTLAINGFDSGSTSQTFTRTPAFDFVSPDGSTTYLGYSHQTTSANRMYVALAAEGSVTQAVATATELEHGAWYGGTFFDVTTATAIPATGSAVFMSGYSGVYVLTDPNGADRPSQTSGEVLFSANLTEGKVEGTVFNRQNVEDTSALPDIVLASTDLGTGQFQGEVYIGSTNVGDYAGIVAGSVSNSLPGVAAGQSPAEVAATLVFKPFTSSALQEYGLFIAPVCGGPLEASTCP